MGRPKKYAEKKEAYTVYNKKKPPVRLSPNEKKLIMHARANEKVMQKWLAEVEMGF